MNWSNEEYFVNVFAFDRDQYIQEYSCADALINAISGYLYLYRPETDQNFVGARKIFNCIENNENGKRDVFDLLFAEVAIKDPESLALQYYKKFKKSPLQIRRVVCNTLNGS